MEKGNNEENEEDEEDEENEEREELINDIHETSDELEGYIDDLIMEVDMPVEEAEDNNTSIERLREIKDAIKDVTVDQEQGLNI